MPFEYPREQAVTRGCLALFGAMAMAGAFFVLMRHLAWD